MSKKMRFLSFILAIAILISSAPAVPVYAEEEASVSAELTNPFRSDVSFTVDGKSFTSNSYRIPSMVTLADGTIVAAADIRWNTTYDGGGLDTLVARSTDGGKTWSYTTANYLGDNGNEYNGSSSAAFLDPSLVVGADGKTVYMLVDLYPYGVALNGNGHTNPSTDVGFNDQGKLLLSGDNHGSYSYYLDGNKIYTSTGTVVEGYTVDEKFNITGNGIESNLFFKDSPFKVVRTGYLYLTSSTDGGASWSAPTLLNNIKTTSEQVCLIAPGSSITTSDGTMIFPVYSFHGDNKPEGNTQRLSFIYSKDGINWSRTEELDHNWASEAAVVELQDGTLRFFIRNGAKKLCYVDYNMENGWGSVVTLTDINTNSNTQISAITYSRTSNGKQVVLVSCPTGPSRNGSYSSSAAQRLNGSIFVLTVDSNGDTKLESTIHVNENNNQFMYSCLTERSDGSVLILFENKENGWGVGDNCFYTMDIKGYLPSALGIPLDEPQNIIVDEKGNIVDSITLGQYEKPELTANAPFSTADVDYQWQIEYEDGKWVDIYGEDSKTVRLSFGMVATLLGDEGKVDIRCKTTAGTQVVYSKPITVTVEMYQPEEPDVVVTDSFITSSGETVTVSVAGALPEDASVQLGETDSTGVDVKPSETVVAALDISIKNADGTEWQPASGETVTVTLEASKIGLKNGDEFVVYHLHNGEVRVLGSYKVVNDTVSFGVDGFSKFVFTLAEQTIFSDDLQSNIGKTATINDAYDYFSAVADPNVEEWSMAIEGEDYPAGIEFIITDVHVSSTYPYNIYYKVKIKDDEVLNDFLSNYPWIYQGHQDEDPSWGTLILHDNTEEPAEPSCGITVDGAAVSEVEVSVEDKVTVTATPTNVDAAAVTYQWQILIPAANMWVNISGQTTADCTINYGMVANRLDSNGQAHIRCVTTVDDTEIISESIAVNIASAASYSMRSLTRSSSSSSSYTYVPLADETGTSGVTKYNLIVKFYLKDTSEEIYQQYLAEFTPGETRTLAIKIPQKAGYTAYWYDGTNATEISGDTYTATFMVSADTTYAVRYFPDDVPYYVIHYIQNVADEGYTQYGEMETKYGKTDSAVPDVHKTIEGFYNIPYVHASIAPDGSTKIEVYYDRWYHLMTFDLGDGGYGVDPVYARYGTEITVGTPTRPGYTFNGWTNWNGANIDVSADGIYTFTVPDEDVNVTAKWTADTAKYTIVYWKENADPDKDANGNVIKDANGDPVYSYSYWAQRSMSTKTGTVVSGSDNVASLVDDEKYFTYNDARTDKNIAVRGDGKTVINVYYTRNYYTINFRGTEISGTCAIPEHTHGTNCDTYLICGKSEHTHSEACGERVISCGVKEHTAHTDACLQCGLPIHTEHTSECLICGKEIHEHSDACCTTEEHTHDTRCCNAHTGFAALVHLGGRQDDCNTGNCGGKPEHTHGDGNCTCSEEEHAVHTDNCYKDKIHRSHNDSCYKDSIHTHTDSCYTYPDCEGAVEHTHTDACYSECPLQTHTHTANCHNSSTDNIVYTITAKYEATIGDIWPTADKFPDVKLYGWNLSQYLNSTTYVSKRINMTANLCADNGLLYLYGETGGSTQNLYYMFESFDQNSAEDGNERRKYNGTYYDKSDLYYQVVNGTGNWSAKEILGMKAVHNDEDEDPNIFFYYTRNRYTLQFQNIDTVVKTVSNVMYEYPMRDLKDSSGNLVSSFVPEYPSGWEKDAYYFAGWYTTPECFEGTKYNFATEIMPASNLMLYAKWAPVTHAVKVYMDDTLASQLNTTEIVDHGSTATSVAKPTHPDGLDFVTWMYKTKDENGNTIEKAFDFSMQIKQDMNIYAVWRSTTIINYEIHYVGIDNSGNEFVIAAPTKGQQIWGKTETFEPKGTDYYYPEYQNDGYFAKTASHSIVMGKNCTENHPDCTWDPVTKTHTFTFYYELGPVVPYEVHYYYEGTTNPVFTDSNGNEIFDKFDDNRKSVVIATARMAVGLKVDAPQKSLVIIKGAENKIIFYYSKDANVSYYTVTHYLIHKDGMITEYQSIPYNATVGDKVENTSANVAWLDIPGFTKDEDNSNNLREGTVTKDPILELKMYYIEKEVTIKYEVANNAGGSVSVSGETLGAQFGVPSGSLASPATGYKFVGWYSHWDCLDSQWLSNDPHYTPTKADTALWIDGTTYYAKFEVDLTSLTIKKEGAEAYKEIDPNQTFIFNIKGDGVDLDVTVHRDANGKWFTTIDGLTVGATYTITEKTNWSWRYEYASVALTNATLVKNVANGAEITLGLDGTITFTNTRNNEQWLDGDSWCNNIFQ